MCANIAPENQERPKVPGAKRKPAKSWKAGHAGPVQPPSLPMQPHNSGSGGCVVIGGPHKLAAARLCETCRSTLPWGRRNSGDCTRMLAAWSESLSASEAKASYRVAGRLGSRQSTGGLIFVRVRQTVFCELLHVNQKLLVCLKSEPGGCSFRKDCSFILVR